MFKNLDSIKSFRLLAVISTIACTVLLGSFAPSVAHLYENSFGGKTSAILRASLGGATGSGLLDGVRLANAPAIDVFYKQRQDRPYWTGGIGGQDRLSDFVSILENSWQQGLNPESYHATKIRALMSADDFESRAGLELLLTDGFIRYARDMSGMRIDPARLKLNPADWRHPMSAQEAAGLLSSGRDAAEILRSLEPASATYQALKAELIRLALEPKQAYEAVLPLDFGKVLIKPGQRHARIPDLRMRLGAEPQSSDRTLYDDRLFVAVVKFQREHGLKEDGIIGADTLEALNRTNKTMEKQIIANLERLRWVKPNNAARYVVVNIPSATLWAIDDNKVAFEMTVIVGRPARPTPSFTTEITGVRFNPNWTVPPTIKRFDILPQLRENPNYLADKGIELYDGNSHGAQTLDPSSVDWEEMSPRDLHGLRMVQMPGDNNPLGKVKVIMPNQYNVYLHDTNHRENFTGTARALSSGCIRMKEPVRMAEFILSAEKSWSAEKTEAALGSSRLKDVTIAQSIPVYVLYYTAWIDDQGKVTFSNDLYGMDRKLLAILSETDGYALPAERNDTVLSSNL